MSDCLDCPGRCDCHTQYKGFVKWEGWLTCYLDFPKHDNSVSLGKCEASHEKHGYPCHHATDGKLNAKNNAWSNDNNFPAYIQFTFKDEKMIHISKVTIQYGFQESTRLKKCRVRFNVASRGWTVPTNIKVIGPAEDVASVDNDGHINLKEEKFEDFEILFDPIDAWQVQFELLETWNNKMGIVNEIILHKAGKL